MPGVVIAWLGSIALATCGRSDRDAPAVRIESVSSETTTIAPGAYGVRLFADLVNGSAEALEVLGARLSYDGSGTALRAQLLTDPTVLPPGSSLPLEFRVDFPPDGSGVATVDASADVLNPVSLRGWRLAGAERPLTFTYADSPSPGSGLPRLTVTTHVNELDGGDQITDIDQAGGSADLSFREAFTIVANLGLPHRIDFDPVVFGPATAQPIALAIGELPDLGVAGTVIDGTGSSVSITGFRLEVIAPRVTLRRIDLTVDYAPLLNVVNGDRLVLEDVDLVVMSNTYQPVLEITASRDVTLTRTFAGGSINGLLVTGSDDLTMTDCTVEDGARFVDSARLSVRGSTFPGDPVRLVRTPDAQLQGNIILGVQSEAALHVGVGSDGSVVRANSIDNMRGDATPALEVDGSQRVTISRNTMFRLNLSGIHLVAGANAGIAPPVITSVEPGLVSGTSAAPDGSLVEVFSGEGFDLDTWVGDAFLASGTFSLSGLSLTPGRAVRATITDPDGNSSSESPAQLVP